MSVIRYFVFLLALAPTVYSAAQTTDGALEINPVRMELFVRSDSELTDDVVAFAKTFAEKRQGFDLVIHDVIKDRDQLVRLWDITKRSKRDKPVVPAFYCCDRIYFGFAGPEQTAKSIEQFITVEVYTRATCPKCVSAKAFLKKLTPRWPGLRFQIYDVTYDASARSRWEAICRSQGKPPGLPTIDFGGQVIIGYQGDDITGVELENLIHRVTNNQSGERETAPATGDSSSLFPHFRGSTRLAASSTLMPPLAWTGWSWQAWRLIGQVEPQGQPSESLEESPPANEAGSTEERSHSEPQTESIPGLDDLLLPEDAGAGDVGEAELSTSVAAEQASPDVIDVPFFGELRPSELGFPLFTFLVGLVDGFNPCAMWILVFLLSVLVNIRERRKILLIAGTFVVVSGIAYFAFMAAWLNLFLLIGIARPIQIILGLMALVIGIVNVKDFFAFKKGISFSIPESSKPGLYKRVREIVSAKYLTVALAGVVALAVIVNMVELLCTAGLPALYTQVLTMQEFSIWKNYGYLALYISAYMFDDSVLLAIVVATLSHRRLQEREGRYLKLVSGLVILALGLVMIFKPEWLQLQA
jgi:glutaredoxin